MVRPNLHDAGAVAASRRILECRHRCCRRIGWLAGNRELVAGIHPAPTGTGSRWSHAGRQRAPADTSVGRELLPRRFTMLARHPWCHNIIEVLPARAVLLIRWQCFEAVRTGNFNPWFWHVLLLPEFGEIGLC